MGKMQRFKAGDKVRVLTYEEILNSGNYNEDFREELATAKFYYGIRSDTLDGLAADSPHTVVTLYEDGTCRIKGSSLYFVEEMLSPFEKDTEPELTTNANIDGLFSGLFG